MTPGALYALGLGEIKLNSALNQPFDAEIELVSATADDLGALRASLASGETFTRYGLDRPAFLSEFRFSVATGADGRDVLRVTSPRPVTEPFVTLLVEANWPRGRLLREYTVLLDPPVYTPGPAASQPVAAAPRVSSGGATSVRAAEPVARESEPVRPAPRPQAAAPAPAASIAPGSTYQVRRNDTLWEIARAANPGSRSDVNRAMVSIFQNNPQAFDGNINVLRSGSTLRIPDSSQIQSISAAEASAEVARQYDAWRAGASGAAAGSEAPASRLRLVPPEQGSVAPSTSTAPATPAATTPAVTSPAANAGGELQTRVQQLEAELAEAKRLLEVRNAELATLQGGAPATPAEGTEVPAATPADTPAATPAEPAAAEPVAAKPAKVKPPKAARQPPPGPTLIERLLQYWWVLLGLLAVGLGALLFRRLRRERGAAEETLEEALGNRDLRAAQPRYSPRPRDTDILVEEKRGDVGRVAAAAATATAARTAESSRKVVTVEDTLSGDGPSSTESSDPLAEADFHMAYGLYDQAADLVQLAMKREPQRRDLKLKLLEIFFVWGNKDRFLEIARDLGGSRAAAPAGEWDKILIMGKQIAPGDALFSGAPTAAASDMLDMELHGAPGMLDLDIPAGDNLKPDMDLSDTEVSPPPQGGIDFILDEPARAGDDSAVLPTIEMPQIRKSPLDESGGDTQELTVDRLGLDPGALQDLDALDVDEATQARKLATSDTVETPTVSVARKLLDDTSADLLNSTALMRMADDTSLLPKPDVPEGVVDLSDATGELPALDSTAFTKALSGGVDFDLGGEPATMSEVGTKLDLARAYMDMGDPEGARSILEEVLTEGNPNQRQEAERLIGSLP
jgi:pilus assembly protein FimV